MGPWRISRVESGQSVCCCGALPSLRCAASGNVEYTRTSFSPHPLGHLGRIIATCIIAIFGDECLGPCQYLDSKLKRLLDVVVPIWATAAHWSYPRASISLETRRRADAGRRCEPEDRGERYTNINLRVAYFFQTRVGINRHASLRRVERHVGDD